MFSVNVRELTISLGSNVIGVRATPNSGSRYFFLLLSSLATLPCRVACSQTWGGSSLFTYLEVSQVMFARMAMSVILF